MSILALRPLSETAATVEANHGRFVELCPGDCATIVEVSNRCVVGESVGVVVALEDIEDPTCCITDELVHVMVRGQVTWGLGCVSFVAFFDWLHGTQFTLVAETVQIDAQYMVISPPWLPCPNRACLPPLRLKAGLGYGCVGKGVRLTELAQIEEPGKSVLVDVPPFATHVTVQPACGMNAEIRLFDCGKGYAPCFTFRSGDGPGAEGFGIGQQIPIPNGVRFVEVFNKNAEGPLTAFVIFGLSL